MCEQTEVNYLDGDVVWVKLGPSWWPGEVLDLSKVAPEIVKSFRKPPIAVVKFFQEDKYEYVKNLNHIYKYNCRRKHEFIKKGLDMHRAKNAFMDKFPADVCHAEMLTNGDPDIITNDEFAPEKKANYSQIFGTPPSNKSKSGSGVRGRRSLGTPKSAGARLISTPRITHPRFLGKSDYEVRILEQSTPQAPQSHYTCHICGFESARLNVIVLHNRSHSNGTYVSPPKQKSKKNSTAKKSKRPKSFATTNSIDEDLELIRQGFTISTEETSDSETEVDKDKKKTTKTIKRKGNKSAAISASKKAKVSSICNNLLADWGDDDSNEEQEEEKNKSTTETTTTTTTTEETSIKDTTTTTTITTSSEDLSSTKSDEEKKTAPRTPEKSSCFDFDDEEPKEDLLEKSPGRKIPRVIPPKRISNESAEKQDTPEKEETLEKEDTPETNEKSKDETDKSTKRDLEAFEKFLQETTVPDFSAISDLSPGKKKPDKKPDASDTNLDKTNGVLKKDTQDSTEHTKETTDQQQPTTITQIPKKRFVRNFDEFETFMNDSRTPSESEETEPTAPTSAPSKSTLEVSKLKSQLMSKLNDSPSKQPDSAEDDEDESSSKESPKEKFFLRRKKSTETLKPDRRKKKLLKDFNEPTVSKTEEKNEEIVEISENEINKETVLEKNKTEIQPETVEEITPISVEEKLPEDSKNLIEEPEAQASDVPEQDIVLEKEEEEIKEQPPIVEEISAEVVAVVDETPTKEETTSVKEAEETIEEDTKIEEASPVVEEEIPPVIEPPIVEEPPPIVEEPLPIVEEPPPIVEEPPPILEEPPPIIEEETPKEDSRSQKMLADISDICIDNSDNLSGLSTLAAVSELSGNLYDKLETVAPPSTESKEESIPDETTNPPISSTEDTESSMTPVQDEIPDSNQQKPVQTLANFSMDFSDSNSESTIIKTIVNEEKIETPEITNQEEEEELKEPKITKTKDVVIEEVPSDFETIEKEINKFTAIETTSDKLNSFPENISQPEPEPEIETNYPEFAITESEVINETNTEATLESEIAKLTDTQPGAEGVVHEQHQNTSSSKLLEILTDAPNKRADKLIRETPRSLISGQSQKVQMAISGDSKSVAKKFDPKTSKFIIKSSKIPSMSSSQTKSNKPIILSEKIIKPVTEIDNVSVKKVTSKRTYQDVEDIDTFIIQKPTKKSNSGEMDQQDIILAPKTDTLQKYRNTFGRPRGKPKIIEQTIIKAADPVQPAATSVNNESQDSPFDDNMFDINSMPIVLSDQILTPESIENMPVVMQNLMPTSSSSSSVSTSSSTNVVEKPQTIITKRGGAMQTQQIKLVNKEMVNVSTSHESLPKVSQNVMVKNIISRGLGKNQKVYQTGSKILKNNPAVITQPGKPGKFIILPSSTAPTPTGSKYTVGKRTAVKTVQQTVTSPTTSKQLKTLQQNIPNEPTGNKIMIITNQLGIKSRVLLTPAQQKILGCNMPTTKITKSPSKAGLVQKSILTSKSTLLAPSNSGIKTTAALASQTIVTSKGQVYTTTTSQPLVTSEGQVLTPLSQQQLKTMKNEQQKFANKKIQMQTQRILLSEKTNDPLAKNKMAMISPKTKTILIKGSQGQTIKKIQTSTGETKNVLLSQTGHKSQLVSMAGGKQLLFNSKGQIMKTTDGKMPIPKQTPEKLQKMTPKTPRIVSKGSRQQQVILQKQQMVSPALPPLAPITAAQRKEMPTTQAKLEQKSVMQKKEKVIEQVQHQQQQIAPAITPAEQSTTSDQKQPNQLVIQDALGNQTTVTEGQILALPSGETVDGQPQSYVLVTVDESGNLVPISNDTLMSLDPNLGAGGDMNNIVLQIDQGAQDQTQEKTAVTEIPMEQTQEQLLSVDNQQLMITEEAPLPVTSTAPDTLHPETFITNPEENQVITTEGLPMLQEQQTAVAINNGDSSQQLIITGDPESTQKFLASLTEGNTDLSSLLSGTDGNIIINTDGQQILLNTDSENQILLSVNSDNLGLIQTSEPDTNQFVSHQQSIKNQDILAAALADTDVFQQESADKSQALTKVSSSAQSQLSPNSSLYPMNVGNVLETSLTLGSPIMTPLEVPSVNNKKITSDVELITQVPSSLELPITITDPSISQTVSQQVMLGNELQTNLDLPISISDSIRSSPNFVYSLPTLDDSSELEQQKQFPETSTVMTSESLYNTALTGSMSMPLLTEEPETPVIEQEQEQIVAPEIPTSHDEEQSSVVQEEATPVQEEEMHEDLTSTTKNEEEIPPIHEEITSIVPSTETEVSPQDEAKPEELCTLPNNEEIDSIPNQDEEKHLHEEVTNNEPDMSFTNPPAPDETEAPEKSETKEINNELHIGPIEEEIDLNNTDMCNSLSEPPLGMFDKSFSLDNKPETTTTNDESINSLPMLSDPQESLNNSETRNDLDIDYANAETERIALSETPNSDLNSPRLDIDENSQEIPIQPPIITTLSATFDENSDGDLHLVEENNKKRANDDDDEHDDNETKRSKLSCD